MKYFESMNSLNDDQCAVETRNRENQSMVDYSTFNYFNNGDCKQVDKQLLDLALENPNLRFQNGYGSANPCAIDLETKIKYSADQLTHGPEKRQYRVRNFTAVPNISRGSYAPGYDFLLNPGEDTHKIRQCDRLTEHNFNRNVPFIDCMEKFVELEAYALPDLFAIGVNSREIVRNQKRCS